MYADDGLLHGRGLVEDLLLNHLESTGIPINKEKSGWVKRNGKWLKPLKFLGLVYDGSQDKLYSETRTGNKLIYDKKDLVMEVLNRSIARRNSESGSLSRDPL